MRPDARMKLARYMGGGKVEITSEPVPACPEGGLLVKTEVCGLCSGELMAWYMDQKIPHVLGHEMSGIIIESQAEAFPVGERVFVHHHAPCMNCDWCLTKRFVHCLQWRKSKLIPGGMAECFAVPAMNLTDAFLVGDLEPEKTALIEPLACVVKAVNLANRNKVQSESPAAIVGLGFMGLLHAHYVGKNVIGYDLNPSRREWAASTGIAVGDMTNPGMADLVYVLPGSQTAFDFAVSMCNPGGTIVMFSPLGPEEELRIPQAVYFKDLILIHSYSCGPDETKLAAKFLASSVLPPSQVISDRIDLAELPEAYLAMRSGKLLKPMVIF